MSQKPREEQKKGAQTSSALAIGIDPDTHESGMAVLGPPFNLDEIQLAKLPLWDLFDTLDYYYESPCELCVAIEAGWMNKGSLSFGKSQRRAIDVGRNHEIGHQIAAFCSERKIEVVLYRPTTKKWSHSEFNEITGLGMARTSAEIRDAARALIESGAVNYAKHRCGNRVSA